MKKQGLLSSRFSEMSKMVPKFKKMDDGKEEQERKKPY